jgi:hypothetical protein
MTTQNLKNLLFCLALGLAVAACRQSSNPEVAPEQPGGPTTKAPTSKVLLTYTGEIKDGDWIEIDELARMHHRLDTSEAVRLPGEPAQFETRRNYPFLFPVVSPEEPWVSQQYFRSSMTGRWVANDKTLGLPPISLVFYLSKQREAGNPYGTLAGNRPYKLSFVNIAADEWSKVENRPSILKDVEYVNDRKLARFANLLIERTDGQPVRIRTSEGYAAKVEYQ